ncbi:MAG: hypothetical protein J7507_07465 [Pseudoxanthomonas sp.]|nr:hypothetical protein [Pseudoxanthomonas sp.]
MSRSLLLSTLLLVPMAQASAATNAAPVAGAPGSTCAFVTDQRATIPKSQDIFPVEITRIDGRSTPLDPRNRHVVQPGTRTLTVTDRIDPHRLPGAAVAQIDKMKGLEMQRAYKPFTIEVQPGVSYAIGARLLRDRLDVQSIRDNLYWEPVVWEQRPEACP